MEKSSSQNGFRKNGQGKANYQEGQGLGVGKGMRGGKASVQEVGEYPKIPG